MSDPCPVKCDTVTVSCGDVLSVIIQAILDLGSTNGSLATDIFNRVTEICSSSVTITNDQFSAALEKGISRGILFRRIPVSGVEPTFMVNGYMYKLNPRNKKYMRFPCASGAFWTSIS